MIKRGKSKKKIILYKLILKLLFLPIFDKKINKIEISYTIRIYILAFTSMVVTREMVAFTSMVVTREMVDSWWASGLLGDDPRGPLPPGDLQNFYYSYVHQKWYRTHKTTNLPCMK